MSHGTAAVYFCIFLWNKISKRKASQTQAPCSVIYFFFFTNIDVKSLGQVHPEGDSGYDTAVATKYLRAEPDVN